MTLPGLVTRYQRSVESTLRATLKGRQHPLYHLIKYQMGWIDEGGTCQTQPSVRVHPTLTLSICEALGGDTAQANPGAMAIELLHQFTRVHDDIQDGMPDHESRPSVWWVWGPAQAINTGDALHVLGRLLLFNMGNQGVSTNQVLGATKVMDDALLEFFEGQYQDLQIRDQLTVSKDSYLKMAACRSGALMGCAAQIGALVAGAHKDLQEVCKDAGRKLGLALHLQHDINELWNTKPDRSPVTIVRKSYPVVYAIETAPMAVKREIGSLFATRVLDPRDLPRLVDLLDEVNAREHSTQAVQSAQAAFLSSLVGIGVEQDLLAKFEAFASYLIEHGMTGD